MGFEVFSLFSTTMVALMSGLIFGFLLQKANVGKFDTIVGQLLLKDFTVMKVILTAILVGGIGIYTFSSLGFVPTFHLSKTPLLLSALGGMFFGIGMSITGYCPGTALVALAQGAKDMIFGVSGMLVGSIIYNEVSIFLPSGKDAFYQKTLWGYLDLSPFTVLIVVALVWGFFRWGIAQIERRRIAQ